MPKRVTIYKTMIQPYREYINFIIASCRKDRIKKLNKLQHRALRRIEYCMNPIDRLYYNVLEVKYNIEQLSVRQKRSLLRIMYDTSKSSDNIEIVSHDINLRNRGKVKIKHNSQG